MTVKLGPTDLLVPSDVIDSLYSETSTQVNIKEINQYPVNHYFVLKSETEISKSALARLTKDKKLKKVLFRRDFELSGIKPRDAKQTSFINSLIESEVLVSVGLGSAGTGKTTLAIAYALEQHFNNDKKIYLSKPTSLVSNIGNAFGPVPGDVNDKYAPYISSFYIVLENILGKKSKGYLELLMRDSQVEFIPIEYTRGCTYSNCTFILDEVQNLTWHELKTVMSRMGENSKLILIGDPYQIDRKFNLQDSGLYTMLSSTSFNQSPITSVVGLKEQYRSDVAKLIATIDEEREVNNANTTGRKRGSRSKNPLFAT
tara:strand:+ start:2301 stop:3245 length:945 start_codon:yes stop_codon:yes gene_type:complete